METLGTLGVPVEKDRAGMQAAPLALVEMDRAGMQGVLVAPVEKDRAGMQAIQAALVVEDQVGMQVIQAALARLHSTRKGIHKRLSQVIRLLMLHGRKRRRVVRCVHLKTR